MLLKTKDSIISKIISWIIMLLFHFSFLDFINVRAEDKQSNVVSEAVLEEDLSLWDKYKKWIILGSGTASVGAIVAGVIIFKNVTNDAKEDTKNYKVCIIGNCNEKQFVDMMNKGETRSILSKIFMKKYFKISGTKDEKNINISLWNVPDSIMGGFIQRFAMKNSDMNIMMLDLDDHIYNRQKDIEKWLDIIKSEKSSSKDLMLVGTYNENIKNKFVVGRLEGLTGCYSRYYDINMVNHDSTLLDMSKMESSERIFENAIMSHLKLNK